MFSSPYFALIFLFLAPLLSLVSCGYETVQGVSIWDPFCREDILYTPYVRVFEQGKGRQGKIIRDRGPGYIDVSGLYDIYVCTNGLVMMYYAKTSGKEGVVFEHGELHWAPHHCELYNPSPNANGLPPDHPKKTLLSILLIGHPQDYRRPALQMFVAPFYDMKYGDFVNLTSLIMIGTDGECLIEKGNERARLRIRNQVPQSIKDMPDNPPIFCQLDAQRKLGQMENIVTLAEPGRAGRTDAVLFDTTPILRTAEPPAGSPAPTPEDLVKANGPKHKVKSDTGPTLLDRYRATENGILGAKGELADDVYAALIADRKMKFVGCLKYPDFSVEQMNIIKERQIKTDASVKIVENTLQIKGDDEKSFWGTKEKPAWLKVPPAADALVTRFANYFDTGTETDDKFVIAEGKFQTHEKALKMLETATNATRDKKAAWQEATGNTKKEHTDDAAKQKAIEDAGKAKNEYDDAVVEELKTRMIFSLWPLKKAYVQLYKYANALETAVAATWTKIDGETYQNMSGYADWTDPAAKKAVVVAQWRYNDLVNLSQNKYERRYDPYDRQKVEQYDLLVNETGILGTLLRNKSVDLGPQISNAETLHQKFKVYVTTLEKTKNDLEKAVKQLEAAQAPMDLQVADPYESYFTDTMIEITDAVTPQPAGSTEPVPPPTPKEKACYVLPSITQSCNGENGIKPSSARADRLLKNRQGKGNPWPTDDAWRGNVTDLISDIFKSVCPYVNEDFSLGIMRIVKGYLLGDPLGTGLTAPILGSRLETADHNYQSEVYNDTLNEIFDNNTATRRLRPKQPFWDQIISALSDCKKDAKPMAFTHNEPLSGGDEKPFITYNYNPVNGDPKELKVDELMMEEKADQEFSFNWAIDQNWRIFATVLGICMPRYEKKIPLISARFYSLYSRDFLHPLRQIWMSNRDNPVILTILGNYRVKGEKWAKICMESSYVESGDRNYRPPRSLYVNSFTEMNYFTTGPNVGTGGVIGDSATMM